MLKDKPTIQLCGKDLQWVDTVNYLGNFLDSNMKEKTEVVMKKGDFIQRVNSLLLSLSRGSDAAVKKDINAQCAHFYGAPAWDFSDRAVAQCQTMWNMNE